MYKRSLIILIALFGQSLILGTGTGTHIVNQTNQPLRVQNISVSHVNTTDMIPGASYFFSETPLHMTVYGPNGICSQFHGIEMNGSIFNYVLIRAQSKNPGCYILGFTGKTRQTTPHTVLPVAIEPDFCKRGCWNPTSGWIAPDLATKAATNYISPQGINRPSGQRILPR